MSLVAICLFATYSLPAPKAKKEKPAKLSTLVKAAHLAIKNSNGQDGAKNNLLAAIPRTDISEKDRANIHYECALLDESKNGVENRKAYLKQPYDTATFFNTLLSMYSHLRLCDSIDALPNSQGNIRLKYSSKTKALRQKHKRNILNGGKFFLSKGQYDVAYNYMDGYYTYSGMPTSDSVMCKVSYWATLCAFMSQKHDRTLKYIDKAITSSDNSLQPILQEYKVRTYMTLGDAQEVKHELRIGVDKYPSHDFFFVNLIDMLYNERNFQEGIQLADSLISLDASKAIYWYSKSKLEMAENNYEKCIEYSDSTIARDGSFVDAYHNKGISYLNLALIMKESACFDMKDPKCVSDRKKIQDLYQKAKPCIEKVRELQPEAIERWGNPLYRIYMNLNLGKEFEEIDKLLNQKSVSQ